MIGPYRIIKKLGPARFKIQHVATSAIVKAHASQLVRHDMTPKMRNLLETTAPHLVRDVRGHGATVGDYLVWERRSIAGWDLNMELFVSQIYQHTKKGILMHHYLDEDKSKAGDYYRTVAARKLAPGYEGFLVRTGEEHGTWEPHHGDKPLIEFLTHSQMLVKMLIPRGELTPQEGWSTYAKGLLGDL